MTLQDKIIELVREYCYECEEKDHLKDFHNNQARRIVNLLHEESKAQLMDSDKLICNECFEDWYKCGHTKLPLVQLTKDAVKILAIHKAE